MHITIWAQKHFAYAHNIGYVVGSDFSQSPSENMPYSNSVTSVQSRFAETRFAETPTLTLDPNFGESGFSETGFGESGRHRHFGLRPNVNLPNLNFCSGQLLLIQ